MVYPGFCFGPGFLINQDELEKYIHYVSVDRRNIKPIKRQAYIFSFLIFWLVLNIFLMKLVPAYSVLMFVVSGIILVFTLNWFLDVEFRRKFPIAVRTKGRRPWGLIFKGLLVTRSHRPWKVVSVFLVFAALAVWRIWAIFLFQTDYPWIFSTRFLATDVMFWLIELAVLLSFGRLIVMHLAFRRRYGRAPRPEDLGSLL